MIWPFKRKRTNPADIRIAGIYFSADRLGLGKTGRSQLVGREFLVAMQSGRDAVYRYASSERATGCDWDWHVLRFSRYASPAEHGLVRYV